MRWKGEVVTEREYFLAAKQGDAPEVLGKRVRSGMPQGLASMG